MENVPGLKSQLKAPTEPISQSAVAEAQAAQPEPVRTAPSTQAVPPKPPGDQVNLSDVITKGIIVGLDKKGGIVMHSLGDISPLEKLGLFGYLQRESAIDSASAGTVRGMNNISKLLEAQKSASVQAEAKPAE